MSEALSVTYSSRNLTSGNGTFDDTPWQPRSTDTSPFIKVTFGGIMEVKRLAIYGGVMQFVIEYKNETGTWKTIKDSTGNPMVSVRKWLLPASSKSGFNYVYIQVQPANTRSYTSGHLIWNLCNETLASFTNFLWNDHSCKILFIIWPFKSGFYCLQNISRRKRIVYTDVVNDATSTCQSVITRVVIRFLWNTTLSTE